ncbi:hypothetical protein [Streptomyces sp. NPDC056323]|uniref:hypothetical protein n=1 Tax=unclassified Streptomyces TaxID=2593676 RepID=UPI0035DA8332
MTNDVDTLTTALYATTDDMLKEHPGLAPWCPPVGITPRLSDALRYGEPIFGPVRMGAQQ